MADPFDEPGVKLSESCASEDPTAVITGAAGAAYGNNTAEAADSGEKPL
jgi:hypothetical protein